LTSRCLSLWLESSLGRGSGLQEHCWGEERGEGHCPSSYKAGRCTPCAGCFQDDFLSHVSGAVAEWRNYRLHVATCRCMEPEMSVLCRESIKVGRACGVELLSIGWGESGVVRTHSIERLRHCHKLVEILTMTVWVFPEQPAGLYEP